MMKYLLLFKALICQVRPCTICTDKFVWNSRFRLLQSRFAISSDYKIPVGLSL